MDKFKDPVKSFIEKIYGCLRRLRMMLYANYLEPGVLGATVLFERVLYKHSSHDLKTDDDKQEYISLRIVPISYGKYLLIIAFFNIMSLFVSLEVNSIN